jgi:hypothetical protein
MNDDRGHPVLTDGGGDAGADDATEAEDADAPDDAAESEQVDPAVFEQRLDELEQALDDADTEDDLDEVETRLDGIEADLADATLASGTAEGDQDGEADGDTDDDGETDDDEDEDPRETFEERIGDLRDGIADQRGPYTEDVTDVLGDAEGTVTASEWTEQGITEVAAAVEAFLGVADETLASFAPDPTVSVSDDSDPEEAAEDIAATLSETAEAVTAAALDPDADADEIAALLDAAETLTGDLEDAQVFGDLEVRDQLALRGFYEVLDAENRKDFPPEWNAIKLYEARGEVEPILTALEALDSDFMQDNILDALEHIAPPAAFDAVHDLAKRRDKQPVRILGRIGDERACDTLHDFLGGGDVALEKTSLWALGAIGSAESTEPVAQRLVADNPEIRSAAARALGLIGDTRAIDPLAARLAEDEDDTVRASAAWALNQIGTARARDTLTDYSDDSSYLVQVETEKAV